MPTPQFLRDFERIILRSLFNRIGGKPTGNSRQPILRAPSPSAPKFEPDPPDEGNGPTILFLSTYPATSPRHGGQKRLANIIEMFRSQGFRTRKASFFPGYSFYTDWTVGSADIALPVEKIRTWKGIDSEALTDLASGEYVASRPELLDRLERYCDEADIIFIEQPWMLPVARRLRERNGFRKARLIFGTQNVEYVLREDIVRQLDIPNGRMVVEGVRTLEVECAQEADLIVAVTDADAAAISTWSQSPVIVAPNGISPWQSTEEYRSRWRAELRKAALKENEPFALYIASAHRPNVIGFCESFGARLDGLAPGQRVVTVGGVTSEIVHSDWFRSGKQINASRLVPVGPISEDDLSALRDLAQTIIVPMTSGGGSNLKMAEALYSGRNVVATPFAMRGYERFEDLPGLAIAQPGEDFARAVSHALTRPLPTRDTASDRLREELTWFSTLSSLRAHAETWRKS